jgi:hypothetical protein
MQIPLIAQQGRGYSLPLNAIKTVNFYPVADPSGKQKTALYGCPGSEEWKGVSVPPPDGPPLTTYNGYLASLNPLVWWKLADLGTVVADSATGGLHPGTIVSSSIGTAGYLRQQPALFTKTGLCTKFYGTVDVAAFAIDAFDLQITGAVTISAVFKRSGDQAAALPVIFGSSFYYPEDRWRYALVYDKATNKVSFKINVGGTGAGGGTAYLATSTTTIADLTAYTVFGRRVGDKISIWVNGVKEAETTLPSSGTLIATGPYGGLYGGGFGAGLPQFNFTGWVDECVLYAAALTDDQIIQMSSLVGSPPATAGRVRGCLELNDIGYLVAGNGFYSIDALGNYKQCGLIDSGTTPVNVETNGFQVAVCDGSSLWIFDITTEVFAQITDPDFPGAQSFAVLDGYGLFNKPGTGQFYITALLDFTNVDALDFATAESSPDDLLRVFSNGGTAWMFGKRTIEPWQNSGDQLFPFSRVGNVRIQRGLAGVNAVSECDGVPMFLGDNRIFYRLDGYSVNPISNEGVEFNVSRMSVVDDCIAMSYTQEGHLFCVFKFPTEKVSWVFDVGTGLWHERVTGGNSWRANCMMKLGNRQLIGDDSTPRLLEIRTDIYADDGQELVSTHVLPTIWEDNNKIRHASLEVDMESGIGSLLGSDPSMVLDWSEDGGRTYGNFLTRQFGKVGQYLYRAIWTRLGSSQERIYRLRISDPVKRVITGVSLNGTDKGR